VTIVDVSVAQLPGVAMRLPAAQTAGPAAARCGSRKRASYNLAEPNGYPFIHFSVESYGRLCVPAMQLLHTLGSEVAAPGQNTVTCGVCCWRIT
jgi:hypothetical protein